MARGRMLEPDSVKEAKQRFIVSGDPVRGWIDEKATLAPKAWSSRSALLASYRDHCSESGGRALGASQFYSRLDQIAGLRAAKRMGTRGYSGITLEGGDPWEGQEGAPEPAPNVPPGDAPSPAETPFEPDLGAEGALSTHSLPSEPATKEKAVGKESGKNLPLLPLGLNRCPEGYASVQHPTLCQCDWRES